MITNKCVDNFSKRTMIPITMIIGAFGSTFLQHGLTWFHFITYYMKNVVLGVPLSWTNGQHQRLLMMHMPPLYQAILLSASLW